MICNVSAILCEEQCFVHLTACKTEQLVTTSADTPPVQPEDESKCTDSDQFFVQTTGLAANGLDTRHPFSPPPPCTRNSFLEFIQRTFLNIV